jgi:hypothetical protein
MLQSGNLIRSKFIGKHLNPFCTPEFNPQFQPYFQENQYLSRAAVWFPTSVRRAPRSRGSLCRTPSKLFFISSLELEVMSQKIPSALPMLTSFAILTVAPILLSLFFASFSFPHFRVFSTENMLLLSDLTPHSFHALNTVIVLIKS